MNLPCYFLHLFKINFFLPEYNYCTPQASQAWKCSNAYSISGHIVLIVFRYKWEGEAGCFKRYKPETNCRNGDLMVRINSQTASLFRTHRCQNAICRGNLQQQIPKEVHTVSLSHQIFTHNLISRTVFTETAFFSDLPLLLTHQQPGHLKFNFKISSECHQFLLGFIL